METVVWATCSCMKSVQHQPTMKSQACRLKSDREKSGNHFLQWRILEEVLKGTLQPKTSIVPLVILVSAHRMHRIHFQKALLASWVALHLPEGQMCQFTEGQSVQVWQWHCLRNDEFFPINPGDGRPKLANTYPTFWHETQNFLGPFFKWATKFLSGTCVWEIPQSTGMWNETLEVKRLFQQGKRVLLSTEFGDEGQMRQLFAEGKWFATSPRDGRSELENTSPRVLTCDSDDMKFKRPIGALLQVNNGMWNEPLA